VQKEWYGTTANRSGAKRASGITQQKKYGRYAVPYNKSLWRVWSILYRMFTQLTFDLGVAELLAGCHVVGRHAKNYH